MAAREMEALTIASMASRDAVSDANERNERNERSMGVRSVGGRAFKRLDGRARRGTNESTDGTRGTMTDERLDRSFDR